MYIIECESRFWDGTGWSEDHTMAKQFEECVDAVLLADQFVEKETSYNIPGEFINIYQYYGDKEREAVVSCIARD